jgi:membrane fusion protein, heavy metal efflux system
MNDASFRSNNPPLHPPAPVPRPGRVRGLLSWFLGTLPTLLALALLAGIGYWGYRTDWALPKFATLLSGKAEEPEDKDDDKDWFECKPEWPAGPPAGEWCDTHGVHGCLLDHPELAQLPTPPRISEGQKKRALQALAFARGEPNKEKCKFHPACIQLKSREAMKRAGIKTEKAETKEMVESVSAPGEMTFDPTRVTRISSRVPGTVRQIFKRIGDQVKAGEVVAVVASAEVSRAKAELLQAAALLNLHTRKLAAIQKVGTSIPAARRLEAGAAVQEARIRVLGAEQGLASLGLPGRAEDFKDLEPEELARRVRVLGLPPEVLRSLGNEAETANLLPIFAPRDGQVLERQVSVGEVVDTRKVLLTVADPTRLWVTVHVRQEQGGRLGVGQRLKFKPDIAPGAETSAEPVEARVSWISPEVDPRTRTILVRAEVANEKGRLRANTFGEGTITQRVEKHAVVVPNDAVHSDGSCQIVFVVDRRSVKDEKGPVIFHVRSVRVGGRDNQDTEIIVGVLPGEVVATGGSAALRGQLLKDSMGAGD